MQDNRLNHDNVGRDNLKRFEDNLSNNRSVMDELRANIERNRMEGRLRFGYTLNRTLFMIRANQIQFILLTFPEPVDLNTARKMRFEELVRRAFEDVWPKK